MTYAEAKAFIEESNRYGSKLGLTTVTELLRRLGNPQDQMKVIHVAGTNGKGSTTAFIASILASEGYLVGRYISPAVFEYLERVQITRKETTSFVTEYITEQGVADTVSLIKIACEEMVQEGSDHPTTFEIETAMAFLYLLSEKVDFAVIEVGMGGRLDATNVITKPVLSVITSISMDHTQYLGDTIGKIAAEKAGIIKKSVPVVTGNTNPEVLKVLKNACERQEAELIFADTLEVTDINYTPEGTFFVYRKQEYVLHLLGEYQLNNALLAIRAADCLRKCGYIISELAIKNGLSQTRWSGRLEILAKDPYIIIDGAHNEDAANQLKNAIQLYFSDRRLIFIIGVLADKDYHSILRLTAPLAKVIITVTPNNNRALASTALAIEAKKYCSGYVIDAGTVSQAIQTAYIEAGKDDIIIAFGSLSYLGEVKAAITN